MSRSLVDTHIWFTLEQLQLGNMTKFAKDTFAEPEKHVRQKAALNRSMLDIAWGSLRDMIRSKAAEAGGGLVLVNPAYTSQSWTRCLHVDGQSRIERGWFVCTRCAEIHADVNGGRNIRKRALTFLKASPRAALERHEKFIVNALEANRARTDHGGSGRKGMTE